MAIKINGNKIKIPNIKKVVIGTQDRAGNIIYDNTVAPFYIKMQTDGTVTFNVPGTVSNFYYKIDNNDWIYHDWEYNLLQLSLLAGQKVYLKADTFAAQITDLSTSSIISADSLVNYTIGGDMQSLNNYNSTVTLNYTFAYFFSNCSGLIGFEQDFRISATTIKNSYCRGMFKNCTGLTAAQITLPAKTLTKYCYTEMFYGCTSLVTAPSIQATSVETDGSYTCQKMFYNCRSLTDYPKFNLSGTLPSYCCTSMFEGCSLLGEVPEKFKLPATSLGGYCYQYLFKSCSNLTLPTNRLTDFLPATDLATSSYAYMFQNCTSLERAPKFPTVTLANAALAQTFEYMFQNCTNLTTVELPTIKLLANSKTFYYMYAKCGNIAEIPEGTFEKITGSFGNNAFSYMFSECTGLINVNSHFPESDIIMKQQYIFNFMFNGCTSLTNVIYNFLPNYTSKARPEAKYTCPNMFRGCTSLLKPIAINWVGVPSYGCQRMYYGCASLQYICNLRGLDFYGASCCKEMYYNTPIYADASGFEYEIRIPVEGTPATPGTDAFLNMFKHIDDYYTFTPTIETEFTCSVPALY